MSRLLGRYPLRVRLVAALVVLVAVGLVVAGFAATSALRSYQLARVDEQLRQAVGSPDLLRRNDGDRPGRGPRPRLPGELSVALLDSRGLLVAGDSTAQRPQLPPLTPTDPRIGHPFEVGGSNGSQWRVLAVALGDGSGTVVVSSDLGEVQRTVDRLVLLQLVIGGVVLLGVSALGYWVVRSSLRGLVEVEEAAAAVAAGDLDHRVPERDPRTELGSLALSFNRMVARVQGAFATQRASEERLRRFVSDAGHELRTPLTSIRGFAELHRQGAVRDPKEVARLLRRIEDEAVRMGLLVEDLLALARVDEQRPLELEPVDLAVLAGDAVHDATAVQPERSIDLSVDGVPVVRGDQARLRQVLANLLSNALQHTPPTAAVRVRVGPAPGGMALVEVADTGPGMTPEVAARVFERFFRADESRTRASGGSGLGLSIVASLVQAHGGRVDLATEPGRGARFRVLLPVDGPPARPGAGNPAARAPTPSGPGQSFHPAGAGRSGEPEVAVRQAGV